MTPETLSVLDLAVLAQKAYDPPDTYSVGGCQLTLTITPRASIFTAWIPLH